MALYSAGDCVVCLDTGAQLMLARPDASVFLYCPSCGTAWRTIHDARTLATIEKINKVAPDGFHVATEAEIERQGWQNLIAEVHADDDWRIR